MTHLIFNEDFNTFTSAECLSLHVVYNSTLSFVTNKTSLKVFTLPSGFNKSQSESKYWSILTSGTIYSVVGSVKIIGKFGFEEKFAQAVRDNKSINIIVFFIFDSLY